MNLEQFLSLVGEDCHTLLAIAGDALEEAGEQEMADALHWAYQHHKWPISYEDYYKLETPTRIFGPCPGEVFWGKELATTDMCPTHFLLPDNFILCLNPQKGWNGAYFRTHGRAWEAFLYAWKECGPLKD